MEITQEQKMYADVLQKAWEDEQFKNELIANPVTAIAKATGYKMNLPKGQTLVVKDQSNESVIYLNIPRKPDLNGLELTEEQLEMVAGGTAYSVTVEWAIGFWSACIAAGYKVGADIAAANK